MIYAIVGSRSWDRGLEDRVMEFVATLVSLLPEDAEVVSGGASGVDSWAEWACFELGVKCHVIKPEYDKYPPKIAPLMRNKEIARKCDIMFAIHNGKSRGTKNAINHAKSFGKEVFERKL